MNDPRRSCPRDIENRTLTPPKRSKPGPQIGIWWDDGKIIVALAHSPTENASSGPLIDSELNHFEQWPEVAARFRLTEDDEYFSVPRGRVLLRRKAGEGIIYHGNATNLTRLRKIAAAFGLTKWTAQRNEHYDMGPEADALFDEDFGDD